VSPIKDFCKSSVNMSIGQNFTCHQHEDNGTSSFFKSTMSDCHFSFDIFSMRENQLILVSPNPNSKNRPQQTINPPKPQSTPSGLSVVSTKISNLASTINLKCNTLAITITNHSDLPPTSRSLTEHLATLMATAIAVLMAG